MHDKNCKRTSVPKKSAAAVSSNNFMEYRVSNVTKAGRATI